MTCIRKQGERVRQESENGLEDDKADVQSDTDSENFIVANVTMIRIMLHGR